MKELFELFMTAPVSTKHKMEFQYGFYSGEPKCTMIVYETNEAGSATGIAETLGCNMNEHETAKAWLEAWISRIAKEREEDEREESID